MKERRNGEKFQQPFDDSRREVSMGRFPIDVVEFVEARFAPRDFAEVFKTLAQDVFSAPRVMRAALFLADGDLQLLKHYARTCATDPSDVLVRAEFVIGATRDPLCAADFSELYRPGQLAGGGPLPGPAPVAARPAQRAKPKVPVSKPGSPQDQRHPHLRDKEFALGSATYVVASEQPSGQYVYCHRNEGESSRLVRLPYVFVMDRLAERIELKSTDFTEF